MPPGSSPPMIVNYDASTVPVLQLALSGKGLDEQQLFDLGLNQIRPQLVTVPGVAMPFPSGGKQRQIQIDIDPDALQARGLSAQDVAAALANQRSEAHTSELQSLMRISYAVFCLKKKIYLSNYFCIPTISPPLSISPFFF